MQELQLVRYLSLKHPLHAMLCEACVNEIKAQHAFAVERLKRRGIDYLPDASSKEEE
jgi:hypothetical protein